MKILINLIILFLFKAIYSDTYYLNKNFNLTIEKGDSMTFLVPDNYRYTNILVYCSLEDTMEISYGSSTVIKTRMYIIHTIKFNEERTYEILLKAKNKPYNFQSLFISDELQVQYSDGEFGFEFSTSYQYLTGALIFVDARNINKENKMLFYHHLAGNDIEFLYFPLTDDIDFRKLCHSYGYQKNAKTGNPFIPEDDYFILKYIGSTFDIKVQYIGVNSDYYETKALISNKEFIKNAEISSNYKYKIDYILGSNENCVVEVKQNYNNSYILLGTLSDNNNRLILPVQNLVLISKNCNAVITIVSNQHKYQVYNIGEQDIRRAYLENIGFTLFRIPKTETNLRVFRFLVNSGYKIGSDYYPCNIFNVGMILIHDDFIEEPITKITIYKQGDSRYLKFFNPYFFDNSYNKFKNDTYYIAFTCNCYFAKANYLKVEYSLFVSKLILKDTEYKVNNRIHQISKAYETFDNLYQIDPPDKENTVLTVSLSSCSDYTFRFFVLSDYNKIIYEDYSIFSTFFYDNYENYTRNEALYIDFENIDDKASFYYEYLPYNKSYHFQRTDLPRQFNITNSNNGKIKISFYPVFYNEEVQYQMYIVKSDDLFQSLCNFYSIDDTKKEIINIGIYNINNNSNISNLPIIKEIDLSFSSNQTLKIGLFYKTIHNYKVQNLISPISFVYEPKYEKDKNNKILIYLGIGIAFVFIIVISVYCIRRKIKNSNNIEINEFKGKLVEKYI